MRETQRLTMTVPTVILHMPDSLPQTRGNNRVFQSWQQ